MNHPQRSRARAARIIREAERWMPILKPLSPYEAAERILYGARNKPYDIAFPDQDIESLAGALLATAGLAQPDDGWQPIETFPDDDTARLVWCPSCQSEFLVTRHDCGWMIYGGIRPLSNFDKPTHWRPLPEPPR